MSQYRVFFVTVEKKNDAQHIAQTLVEERLAACVNIVPAVESFFRWEGKVDHADELLLIIKSTQQLAPKLIERVKQLHPYDIPEVIELSIEGGNSDYLRWIDQSLEDGE